MNGEVWDYIGVLTYIEIKGRETAKSHECVFTLKASDGSDKPFKLDPFEVPERYAAMLQVLTSAVGTKVTVYVRTLDNAKDVPIVYQIVLRWKDI